MNNFVELEAITDGTPITYGVVQPGNEDVNGVKFIRGGDISNGKISYESLRTITNKISGKYKRTILKGGEVVISLVGNPGEVAVVGNSLIGCNRPLSKPRFCRKPMPML